MSTCPEINSSKEDTTTGVYKQKQRHASQLSVGVRARNFDRQLVLTEVSVGVGPCMVRFLQNSVVNLGLI